MKRLQILIGIGILSLQLPAFAADNTANGASQLKSESDKISYTIGADMGKGLRTQDVKINPDLLGQGLKDAYTGNKLKMTQEEMKNTIQAFQQQMVAKHQEKAREMATKNEKIGQDFLTKNKAKNGVVTLPSGLQYKVVTAGKGQSPNENSVVKVDYEGKLIDGQVFDSTYERGQPVEFQVNRVIPGCQEALQKMKISFFPKLNLNKVQN